MRLTVCIRTVFLINITKHSNNFFKKVYLFIHFTVHYTGLIWHTGTAVLQLF